MTDSHLSELRFDTLELDEQLRAGIRDAGFEFCTPIQALTLPIALDQRDVAGQAQTGTGKTAAFLIAAYQRLLNMPAVSDDDGPRQPRIFILAPTRELAVQIANDAELLGKHTGFKVGLAFGGTGYEQQRRTIQDGIDLLIGTPGRIIDYFKQGVFKLSEVQVAVLDEADRMFDLGFIKDIRYLLRRLSPPDKRLNMLFSATFSESIEKMAEEFLDHYEKVEMAPSATTVELVTQKAYKVPNYRTKLNLIQHFLIDEEIFSRVIIFAKTKEHADGIFKVIKRKSEGEKRILHSNKGQNSRINSINAFKNGEVRILIFEIGL